MFLTLFFLHSNALALPWFQSGHQRANLASLPPSITYITGIFLKPELLSIFERFCPKLFEHRFCSFRGFLIEFINMTAVNNFAQSCGLFVKSINSSLHTIVHHQELTELCFIIVRYAYDN